MAGLALINLKFLTLQDPTDAHVRVQTTLRIFSRLDQRSMEK